MTHVGSAGRPHFLCSRILFFSSSPFLLLLSYFLLYGWTKPLLIVLLSKIMGGRVSKIAPRTEQGGCLGYSVLDAGLSFGRRGLVYI